MEHTKERESKLQRVSEPRKSKLVAAESNINREPNHLNILIAVYGTLKRDKHNHPLLLDSLYIGEAVTEQRYPLVISRSGLPFLVDAPGVGKQVHVELYLTDGAMLNMIDTLEGHPEWYERRKTRVVVNNDFIAEPWIYFAPDDVKYVNEPHLDRF